MTVCRPRQWRHDSDRDQDTKDTVSGQFGDQDNEDMSQDQDMSRDQDQDTKNVSRLPIKPSLPVQFVVTDSQFYITLTTLDVSRFVCYIDVI